MVVLVSGWGQVAWAARLTCHLVYFLFTTRGAERRRRTGLSRRRSRWRKPSQPEPSWPRWSGGKGARVGDGLAGDPQCGDEADPVGVVPGVCRGLGHQRADREVAAQVTPDLLEYQLR